MFSLTPKFAHTVPFALFSPPLFAEVISHSSGLSLDAPLLSTLILKDQADYFLYVLIYSIVFDHISTLTHSELKVFLAPLSYSEELETP